MRRVVIGLGLVCALLSIAAAVTAAPVTSDTRHVFRLKFGDYDYEVSEDVCPLTTGAVYMKEPARLSSRVRRGHVPLGGGASQGAGYLLDEGNRRLYLDLNGNGDLTDDPDGVLNSGSLGWNYRGRMERTSGSLTIPYDVEFEFMGGSDARRSIVSGWRGRVTLDGMSWELSVADDGDGIIGAGADAMVIEPSDSGKSDERSGWQPSRWRLSPARRLFIGGRTYDVNYTFDAATSTPDVLATFTGVSVPMGRLCIPADKVRQLVLQGPTYTVVLDDPTSCSAIPTGEYKTAEFRLGKPGGAITATAHVEQVFHVDKLVATTLKGGGMPRIQVTTKASGRTLRVDHSWMDSEIDYDVHRKVQVFKDRTLLYSPDYWDTWRVPVNVWGELRVVVSCDLKELGQIRAEQKYDFNPLRHLLVLVPWLFLFALLVLPANRTAQAALPLISFAGVMLLHMLVENAGWGSVGTVVWDAFVVVAGMYAALLLATPLAGRRGGIAAAARLFAACWIAALACSWHYREHSSAWPVLTAVGAGVTVAVCAVAARMCRGNLRGLPFAACMLLSHVVLFGIVTAVVAVGMIVGCGSYAGELTGMMWLGVLGTVFYGVAAGIGAWVVALPFLVVAFGSSLYRDRIRRVCRVPDAEGGQ